MKAFGDVVHAFRVIWRNDDGLAHAWDEIASKRHLCDQVVAQTPHLHMFVSCISGVFTHPACAERRQTCDVRPRPVYPAVSYWAVLEEVTSEIYADLTMRLWNVCPSAQVKDILTSTVWQEDETLATDCGPLFVTLKDHSSRYVYQKINHSRLVAGDNPDNQQLSNAKLAVMAHSKYIQQVPLTVESLRAVGLSIDFEVLAGERNAPVVL